MWKRAQACTLYALQKFKQAFKIQDLLTSETAPGLVRGPLVALRCVSSGVGLRLGSASQQCHRISLCLPLVLFALALPGSTDMGIVLRVYLRVWVQIEG